MASEQIIDLSVQLDRNIKDVIDEFAPVGKLLAAADVNCVTCAVGTCKLKDIIEIHNLTVEQEASLLDGIAKIIYPGREVRIPPSKRAVKAKADLKYAPPVQDLVDEHVHIKKLLGLVPAIIEKFDANNPAHIGLVKEAVNFIKQYADKFHHAKEEDVLFEYFDENLDVLQVMYEDHDTGRNHVKNVLEGLRERDGDKVKKHLAGYMELLKDHIKREDEVLYPYLEKNMTPDQIADMTGRFKQVDADMKDIAEKSIAFVDGLEARLK